MIALSYLESLTNWQATFRNTRTGRFHCLMRTITGGFYWHEADYDGLFPWGATSGYSATTLADSLKRGILELHKGQSPLI